MSTPTDPTRLWSVFTFLPGSLSAVEVARLGLEVDLGFAPAGARLRVLGDDDVDTAFDSDLPARIAALADCTGFDVDGAEPLTGSFGFDTWRTNVQVSLRPAAPDPRLVRALVMHPGFIAGASGDAEDERWQSEDNPNHYRMWFDGPWEHLPRTTDDVGREVIDVSGNPGRMTDVPGMRMWAAQDTWFGAASALMIDHAAIASLPVGRVTDLGGGCWHVRLWEDGATLDEIRKAQQTLRDHLRYDEATARDDEIWDTLTAGQPEDPMFVVQEGSFPHGGTQRFLQYFSAKKYPTTRSRAAWLNVQEFDEEHQQRHVEDFDLTSEPHPDLD